MKTTQSNEQATAAPKIKKSKSGNAVTKVAPVANYRTLVLEPAKKVKKECQSLGHARAVLIAHHEAIDLNPIFLSLLERSKDKDNYKVLAKYVRCSKKGAYSPFYVLQALRKHGEALQKAFK